MNYSNKQGKSNLPEERDYKQEFLKGEKPFLMCSDCGSVYFDKHWHHKIDDFKNIDKENNFQMKFKLCPACEMIKNKQYEGRVTIKNVSKELEQELGRLITSFCRTAFEIDPLDRLIDIKKGKDDWEVTITENQLANKLAKKIKEVFNKIDVEHSFASDPSDVVEVTVEFK